MPSTGRAELHQSPAPTRGLEASGTEAGGHLLCQRLLGKTKEHGVLFVMQARALVMNKGLN